MKKYYLMNLGAALIVLSLMFFTGCEQKSLSRGTTRNIAVVVDSVLWQDIEVQVKSTLSPERFTPQPEYIFALNQMSPNEFTRLERYAQILFIGTLDMEGETKNLLDQMMPSKSEARKLVQNNERYFFQYDEPWARDQILGILVGKDKATLIENLKQDDNLIFNTYDEHANYRVKKQLYFREPQEKLVQQLMDNHGWTVDVPLEWFIAMENDQDRFVWIRRMRPQREFFVYWEPVDDPSVLSKEWMLETRARLAKKYYSGDEVYQDDNIKVREEVVNFLDRYAIKLEGIWQNDSLVAGGPFRSYGFYNESDQRLYLIDGSVYAPDERKWPYLRHLDIVAHTFRTKGEVKKQQE